MPEEARKRAEKEIKKLKMMSPMSAEATVVRNYIDWMISLPWEDYKQENRDINDAERVLDEDHYGLEKPKERIVEYLAVQALVEKIKGPILCLVGPPGVGKTSLGKSIARATGRDFVRVSLGGVRDEAEIRGHRRTYIGALPGKIIQSLKKAGSGNPVFLLDEVDKMSMDFRGDPSAALLEVLDPEQNHTFNDHYLDLDYDLSRIMFVCTANVLSQIPRPLQDRMEIIHIPGYIESEKLSIAHEVPGAEAARGQRPAARAHRVERRRDPRAHPPLHARVGRAQPRARDRLGLPQGGARGGEGRARTATLTRITPARVKRYLGVPKYRFGRAEEDDRVGVCTGLAYTEVGGELLQTEVSVTPGKGKLQVTGRLGEVMQESANAALSYVRSRAKQLGLDARLLLEGRHPHPRARGRHAEGRPVGGHHDRHRDRVGADARAGALERRDDRRDHAARARAADRRAQGEDDRGAARRHRHRADPEGEREGSRRDPGQREARAAPDRARRAHGRGARRRALAGRAGDVPARGRPRVRRHPRGPAAAEPRKPVELPYAAGIN